MKINSIRTQLRDKWATFNDCIEGKPGTELLPTRKRTVTEALDAMNALRGDVTQEQVNDAAGFGLVRAPICRACGEESDAMAELEDAVDGKPFDICLACAKSAVAVIEEERRR